VTMTDPQPLPLEPGWYRAGTHGLEPIPDDEAQAAIDAGQGFELVHVKLDHEEVPLW